ncbi:hypothetical protein [Burkholderia mayonis]|uniref:hypothetical protein n=1 Tax=Burkholderia mayonis TaxID=1385591 RepID=UPI000AE76493|nr:hypothetical protein [Burkholderia mayonis]
MRTLHVVTLLFLLLSLTMANPAKAGEARQDGNWWNVQQVGEKGSYVSGFVDGMMYESEIWDIGLTISQGKKFDPVLNRYAANAEKFANDNFKQEFGHLTIGQLVDGLDHFYTDYRNRRISVRNAMVMVVRSMDGTSEEEMSKLIEYQRKKASE